MLILDFRGKICIFRVKGWGLGFGRYRKAPERRCLRPPKPHLKGHTRRFTDEGRLFAAKRVGAGESMSAKSDVYLGPMESAISRSTSCTRCRPLSKNPANDDRLSLLVDAANLKNGLRQIEPEPRESGKMFVKLRHGRLPFRGVSDNIQLGTLDAVGAPSNPSP